MKCNCKFAYLIAYIDEKKQKEKNAIFAAALVFICTIESNALKSYNRVENRWRRTVEFQFNDLNECLQSTWCLARPIYRYRWFVRPNKLYGVNKCI